MMTRTAGIGIIAGVAVTLACGDQGPVTTSAPPPASVEVVVGGTVAASADAVTSVGDVVLAAGQPSAGVQIRFLDAAGAPRAPGADEFLTVTVGDVNRATWFPDAPGAFSGRFHGGTDGTTTMVLQLFRRGDAQAQLVFTSATIPINVS